MWDTGLFECFATKEFGPFCCVQHCCCQPCIVSSALKQAGLKNADLIGITLALGGESVLDEAAAFFARRKVIKKYNIEESEFSTALISCCCQPFSNVQLVNTLMVRENLSYGCAHVKGPPRPKVPVPPKVTRMSRQI